ncbi:MULTISPECIES: SIS domain-containing protein [Yimella]|uniref:DNA-binding MurR/RpiR family transcriptional regulator n=1 Tax=Yimella lutea TaxID=587872 RepID=A0A542EJM6_9MICO|nr:MULTISPECIES: SIS domain-containing protein [Yimella]MCG8654684.1 phosphosugar isomerase [Yimella sp. NH-Cas1]TQJ15494.1 DNA-binding MurR/RpiR family transcriptional regulator [Yimella lutea]
MPELQESWVDDPDELALRDSRDTLRALASAGAQVRESITLSQEAGIERIGDGTRPRSVLVAAVGGTKVVGDVLRVLAEAGSPVPVASRSNVPLPGWVGPLDMVIAVSLSGRAPGPLGLAIEAARRGASLLTVGAEDSPLADVTRQARGVHVGVGRGRSSSRTALWSLLTPVLLGAHQLGIADASTDALTEASTALDQKAEECRPSSESFVNPAKLAAATLAPTVPMILGDGALTGVAAVRAAGMLARTARVPASYGSLPDAASEVVACFDGPFTAGGGNGTSAGREADIFADPFLDGPAQPRLGLLMLRDVASENPDSLRQVALADAVKAEADAAGCKIVELVAAQGHPIARLAGHLAMVDYIATYLAIGTGIDPSISPHVADLRDRTRGF